jgi:hypothetical protein
MRKIVLFVEDYGHEEFIEALVNRLARDAGVAVKIIGRSVRGGYGKAVTEFKRFLDELERGKEALPDLLIVATDANCKGYVERKQEIDKASEKYSGFITCAIPDPHIERWLLIDSSAFKTVVGKGCSAPDQKCDRGRYKQLLLSAMQNAGIVPPLGGVEYTRDIVDAMDLTRAATIDASFDKFLKDLNNKFKLWSTK